ncbi:hypothetical protein [Dyella lutea]|uniref:Uncharacterized protein n=1 Tax=Dyella lutea TaxID=2950441 RepID=A0ABT1FF60_9GAMM|nr:hypothetical protein [Dyella lutea]MCP1376024.1 hypothetical protein [Dyella lutea]
MAFQDSVAVQNAMLNAFASTVGASPKLDLWNDGGSGRPANDAAAATGTKIAEGTLPATPFTTSTANAIANNGTWTVTGLPAAGTGTNATYYRLMDSAGTTCHQQGAVHPLGSNWAASTAYALNAIAYANDNVYKCTTAGTSASSGAGPSGTGTGITDGTAVWAYVSDIGIGLSNISVTNGESISPVTYSRSRGNS